VCAHHTRKSGWVWLPGLQKVIFELYIGSYWSSGLSEETSTAVEGIIVDATSGWLGGNRQVSRNVTLSQHTTRCSWKFMVNTKVPRLLGAFSLKVNMILGYWWWWWWQGIAWIISSTPIRDAENGLWEPCAEVLVSQERLHWKELSKAANKTRWTKKKDTHCKDLLELQPHHARQQLHLLKCLQQMWPLLQQHNYGKNGLTAYCKIGRVWA
jgi:hypothetical protein